MTTLGPTLVSENLPAFTTALSNVLNGRPPEQAGIVHLLAARPQHVAHRHAIGRWGFTACRAAVGRCAAGRRAARGLRQPLPQRRHRRVGRAQ